MPNWCSNSTKIEGKKEMVLDCLTAIGNGDTDSQCCLDFEKILPMPEEFHGVHEGNTTIDGKQVSNWREVDGRNVAISKSEINRLTKKYGSFGWYNWSIANWGTKWSIDDTFAVTYNLDGTELYEGADYGVRIDYETPWCPAEGILKKIQADWPELRVRTKWTEEGMDATGVIRFNPDGSEHPDSYTRSCDDW